MRRTSHKKSTCQKIWSPKKTLAEGRFWGRTMAWTGVRQFRFEMCIDSDNLSPLSIIIFSACECVMILVNNLFLFCYSMHHNKREFIRVTFAPLLFIHFYFSMLQERSLPMPQLESLMSCPTLFPRLALMFIFFAPYLHIQVFLIRACECSFSPWIFHFNFEVSALLFSSGTGNPLYPLSLSLWLPVHKSSCCWPNLTFTLVMTPIFGEYA